MTSNAWILSSGEIILSLLYNDSWESQDEALTLKCSEDASEGAVQGSFNVIKDFKTSKSWSSSRGSLVSYSKSNEKVKQQPSVTVITDTEERKQTWQPCSVWAALFTQRIRVSLVMPCLQYMFDCCIFDETPIYMEDVYFKYVHVTERVMNRTHAVHRVLELERANCRWLGLASHAWQCSFLRILT